MINKLQANKSLIMACLQNSREKLLLVTFCHSNSKRGVLPPLTK